MTTSRLLLALGTTVGLAEVLILAGLISHQIWLVNAATIILMLTCATAVLLVRRAR